MASAAAADGTHRFIRAAGGGAGDSAGDVTLLQVHMPHLH